MPKEKEERAEKKGLELYRPYRWLAPFEEMERMFDEFLRRPFGRMWLPRLWGEEIQPSPSVDIFEEGDDIVVKSELPGMEKDDIEVNITENVITLSGEKKKEEKVESKDYYHLERSYGSFSRSFTIPKEIQPEKAKASFKNGVLEIRIPKTEEAKKKIQKIKIE